LVAEKALPGGIESNRKFLSMEVDWGSLSESLQQILLDPQTSGGLLISIPRNQVDALSACAEKNKVSVWQIGEVVERGAAAIIIR
jgi:selenide,water dikinase